VRREFETRYQNSLLGTLWSLLTPLATIVIYVLIFSQLMRARLPNVDNDFAYGVYICAGVLTWGMFAEVISRCQSIFIENANMLKKLSFPRICLPIIVVCNSLINLTIMLFILLVFLFFTDNNPGITILAIIPLLAIQLTIAVAIGVFLGVLNVFFRDVAPFTGIMLQLWFWFTPIIYPLSILPEWVRELVLLNPMTHIIVGYQTVFVYGAWPEWSTLLFPLIVALLLSLYSFRLYKKRGGEIVDEL